MLIETLEARRLLTVTVSEAYPGFYEVHGDGDNDVIDIAVSQSGESFTLDGTTYSGVAYIYVHAYGGEDFISLYSDEGAGSIAASVSAGDGTDTVLLNFDGAIWGGDGNDIIYLTDSFRGGAYGQCGDDEIYVSGACVDPDVYGGDGDDRIDASANYCGVVIHGEKGKDVIYGSDYDDEIHGDDGEDALYGGAGNDVFYTRDGDHDEVHGQGGVDIVYADLNGDGIYEMEYEFLG
jgi:Ca2+-binding RTX toxin-like protein